MFNTPLSALCEVMSGAFVSGEAEDIMPSVTAPYAVVGVVPAMPFLLRGKEFRPFLWGHIRAAFALIGEILFAVGLAPFTPVFGGMLLAHLTTSLPYPYMSSIGSLMSHISRAFAA